MTARLLPLPPPGTGRPLGPTAVPTGAAMAVALFNDPADHADIACQAASQGLRRLLRRRGAVVRAAAYRHDWQGLTVEVTGLVVPAPRQAELRDLFAHVDAVVVDAGRSLAGGRGRHLLAVLAAAQRAGLPTFLVNTILDRLPEADGRMVLAGLTDCTVPDAATARLLRAHGIAHREVPDAIFAAEFLETPTLDLRDHLVLLDVDPPSVTPSDVAALCSAWSGPVRAYGGADRLRTLDWRHAIANLRTAAAVVCGSHHAACLAMLAGVPFVRTDAVDLPLLGGHGRPQAYPVAAADPARPLRERLAAARADAEWFSAMGTAGEYLLPLDTFATLVPGLAPAARPEGRAVIDDLLAAVRRTTAVGGSVLHAGAGAGRLVEALAASGYRAWGTDAAWRLAHPDRQRYSIGTPWALPFADHVFSTVVVSAGWLDHLELDDLDQALAEIARVGRDTVVLEVSGRALRARRAIDGERRELWWEERLDLHGFRAPLTARPIANGPHSLVVMHAAAAVCAGCGRVHGRSSPHGDSAPAPAVVAAAAARGSAARG
ncbi:MAG: methyltransferase domain-containing protein [Vicinamibacterales bacterium]